MEERSLGAVQRPEKAIVRKGNIKRGQIHLVNEEKM